MANRGGWDRRSRTATVSFSRRATTVTGFSGRNSGAKPSRGWGEWVEVLEGVGVKLLVRGNWMMGPSNAMINPQSGERDRLEFVHLDVSFPWSA